MSLVMPLLVVKFCQMHVRKLETVRGWTSVQTHYVTGGVMSTHVCAVGEKSNV